MIHYFYKKLRLSIQAQLDHQRCGLGLQKEVIKKAVNVEVKTNLQPPFKTKEINSKCPKGYKLSAKKEKNKASWEHKDRDKDKAKYHNPLFTNTNQLQTQASKKNKRYKSC